MSRRRSCSIRPDSPGSTRSAQGTGRFTLASSEVRPLDRLRQLRGPETAVAELCDGNQDLRTLARQTARVFPQRGRALGKNPGRRRGSRATTWPGSRPLRGHLKIWRSLFKPLFQEYCAVLHRHDKFVFFLSEGTSGEAMDDLVEIGVDAVHAQWPRRGIRETRGPAPRPSDVLGWRGAEKTSSLPVNAATFARPFFAFARPSILGPEA